MGVVKDWRCEDCGNIFESDLAICPTCGNSERISRTFTTPPAFKSDKTKLKDGTIDGLLKDYRLTDFSNNQNTKHEKPIAAEWKDAKELVTETVSGQNAVTSGSNADLMKTLRPIARQAQQQLRGNPAGRSTVKVA